MTFRIITFNPWLYAPLGHSLIYTQFIEKASELNGWAFIAALPQKCLLEDLPKNWHKSLGCPTVRHWFEAVEKRPYRRPRKAIRARERVYYYYSSWKFLKKLLKKSNQKTVLFLEAFAQTDVRLLTNLLHFLPKKNLSVWLIHRYQSSKMGSDVPRYRALHEKIVKQKIGLKLLTDSDLLKEDLENAFKLPFTVLPIHYVEEMAQSPKRNEERVICWWPGLTREGKGLQIIQRIAASKNDENMKIHLVANEKTGLKQHPKSPKITLLPDHLSREDYLQWMEKSQVILLPYTDPLYEKTTSSIFIEAIFAGKIPLVYPKTWMAYELSRYDLNELILDWEADLISKKILSICSNKNLLEKLKVMKKSYQNFHSLNHYAEILKTLID